MVKYIFILCLEYLSEKCLNKLNCGHNYCKDCMKTYLKKTKKALCGICRNDIKVIIENV